MSFRSVIRSFSTASAESRGERLGSALAIKQLRSIRLKARFGPISVCKMRFYFRNQTESKLFSTVPLCNNGFLRRALEMQSTTFSVTTLGIGLTRSLRPTVLFQLTAKFLTFSEISR